VSLVTVLASRWDQRILERFREEENVTSPNWSFLGERSEACANCARRLREPWAPHGTGAVEQYDDAARCFGIGSETGGRNDGGEAAFPGEDPRLDRRELGVEHQITIGYICRGRQRDLRSLDTDDVRRRIQLHRRGHGQFEANLMQRRGVLAKARKDNVAERFDG
jgi:hypothetical protein